MARHRGRGADRGPAHGPDQTPTCACRGATMPRTRRLSLSRLTASDSTATRSSARWGRSRASAVGSRSSGSRSGVLVIDDYAHHPTAIRATIAALRERHGGRRLWAVHEPLTYHRTAAMLEPLADALATADEVVIADIWAGRRSRYDGHERRRPRSSRGAPDRARASPRLATPRRPPGTSRPGSARATSSSSWVVGAHTSSPATSWRACPRPTTGRIRRCPIP